MTEEERYLQARLQELEKRSYARGVWQFSEFLTLAEQNLLPKKEGITLVGGYDSAERRIAAFGSEALCGYLEQPPIQIVCIQPVQKKFSDTLSHRDFLGTLMGTGIRRSLTGDILVSDNVGYVFCLQTIADYIMDNVTSVRHTTVSCSLSDTLPEGILPKPEIMDVSVASLRCDALIAAAFHLSRGAGKEFFEKELVFADGRMVVSPGYVPAEGTIISVRGKGRFRLLSVSGQTRKGRLIAQIEVFR